MTKDYAASFWSTLLNDIRRDQDACVLENPALEFTKRAKAGEYDRLTDDEYSTALNDVEQASALFRNKRAATSRLLLLRALMTLSFRDDECSRLVDLLSDISAHTDFCGGQPH